MRLGQTKRTVERNKHEIDWASQLEFDLRQKEPKTSQNEAMVELKVMTNANDIRARLTKRRWRSNKTNKAKMDGQKENDGKVRGTREAGKNQFHV